MVTNKDKKMRQKISILYIIDTLETEAAKYLLVVEV